MAHQQQQMSNATSNLNLEAFTKYVPPGWRPHIKGYTFRRYQQKLKLW